MPVKKTCIQLKNVSFSYGGDPVLEHIDVDIKDGEYVGIVGPNKESIFNQNYFAGLGVGLRIRNENLIFKTIQLRLAYYPNFPQDVSPVGIILDEVSKSKFYSFQPRGPEPMRFE